MEPIPHSEKAAREALRLWGMEGASLAFLRHNENETWKAVREGRAFLLRLHRMTDGFSDSIFGPANAPALREGEIRLLLHLGRDGRVPVQAPVELPGGGYVARLEDGTPATLLCWLEGRTLTGCAEAGVWRDAGRVAAALGLAAEAAPDLPLRRYDSALWRRMAEELGRMETGGAEIFVRAAEEVLRRLRGAELRVRHSDLGPGNLVRTADGVAPIDFGLCGYAAPEMDLASLLAQCDDGVCRRAALEGYREIEPGSDWARVEACYAAQVLLFLATHRLLLPQWTDWIGDALERWRRTVCLPLLEGRGLIDV